MFVSLVLLSSCKATKNVTSTDDSNSKKTSFSNNDESNSNKTELSKNDGSSLENAILINAKNEQEGVRAEYVLLAKMYPNYKVKSQSTMYKNSKNYDVLNFVTSDGIEKTIYFDISKFYGKF